MKLGEIARVSRGLVTGNTSLFVMTREQAAQHGIDRFVRPVINGAREVKASAVLRDRPDRLVVLLATPGDLETYPELRIYLGGTVPRIGTAAASPIVATYVGMPHFAANPDELVVLNSLYRVTPRRSLSSKETSDLVHRLNAAARGWQSEGGTGRRSPAEFQALEI
jgi:hypothetical protein